MAGKKVFLAYDFEIKRGLIDDFDYVKENKPVDIDIEWPGRLEGRSQGEIWRNMVRPKLDAASRFVAYVDLPNANVGFEIGYALGHREGKEAALAHISPEIPKWLQLPPLKGFFSLAIRHGEDLLNQITSENWFRSPRSPRSGEEILLLCPPTDGFNQIALIQKRYPTWRLLPEVGWSFNDLPDKLDGVGVVVWLIVPHREGENARDGSENAAAAVVAGYAEACGMRIYVLKHREARVVVDVAPKALDFGTKDQLLAHLGHIEQELENLKAKTAAFKEVPSQEPSFSRPHVGVAPALDAATYTDRFIGRKGMLEDLADALRGLNARAQGQPVSGAAKVQAFWYHGFGGMGKSWFLRKAMLQAGEMLPAAKVALIDWDHAVWRAPLLNPPESKRDLLNAIAFRLAQLYAAESLDLYWRALHRTETVRGELSRLQERFNQQLRELREGKGTDQALRIALSDKALRTNGDGVAKSLDELQKNASLRKEVFDRWFEDGGGSTADPEAVLRPDVLRTQALQESIRSVATSKAPLVLVLDTCEHLTDELERSLRQLIAPLCDGALPLLVLLGGRLPPDRWEPLGSREHWRALVGEERWRSAPFDEGVRFTVQEIQQSLQRVTPPVRESEELAERLLNITLGVPLALRSLIDLHEGGSDVLSQLEDLQTEEERELDEESAVNKVIQVVADRFLLHLTRRHDRIDDFRDIITLSLLPKPDLDVLSKVWSARNVRSRLRELATKYVLLAGGDLHETVRSFLRRRWRMEDRPSEVDEMIDNLDKVLEEVQIPDQPGDMKYMETLTIKLAAKAWKEESKALTRFAPAIATALAFNQHISLLIEI